MIENHVLAVELHLLRAQKYSLLGTDNGKNRVVEAYTVQLDENLSIGDVPEDLLDCVKAAAESCPVNAIKYEVIK